MNFAVRSFRQLELLVRQKSNRYTCKMPRTSALYFLQNLCFAA
jgi:hypothetical protein